MAEYLILRKDSKTYTYWNFSGAWVAGFGAFEKSRFRQISLYTIFADCRACLPDIHVQTLKGIHFLKPLLKGVVWKKTEFYFVAHVLRTKPLIVEKWFAPKLSV